jgi:hypothetical protein
MGIKKGAPNLSVKSASVVPIANMAFRCFITGVAELSPMLHHLDNFQDGKSAKQKISFLERVRFLNMNDFARFILETQKSVGPLQKLLAQFLDDLLLKSVHRDRDSLFAFNHYLFFGRLQVFFWLCQEIVMSLAIQNLLMIAELIGVRAIETMFDAASVHPIHNHLTRHALRVIHDDKTGLRVSILEKFDQTFAQRFKFSLFPPCANHCTFPDMLRAAPSIQS